MTTKKFLDADGVKHLWGKIKTENGNYLPLTGGTLVGDVVPFADNTYSLGTSEKAFKEIYAHELKLSTNSLYLGDTKILGTDANTINIRADAGQSLALKSQGSGVTNVQSFTGVTLETIAENGTNPDGSQIKIKALGSGSSVSIVAPTVAITGATTVSSLTVTGNLSVAGTTTSVNSNNLEIKDNIIEVNKGETGNGVTAGTAGIKIDRGEKTDYFIVFDESDDKLKVGIGDENVKAVATEEYVGTALSGKLGTTENAASASKLNVNGGSATQPIYFANGIPTETTYTLGASVPSDAVFTDTVYTHPASHPATMITGLADVATSGSYNDLDDTPTIPTEDTVAGWGFTKNAGTYTKASTGIPKSDLASAVQTSLGLADTALQSYTETDPVFSASAAAGITADDITNWNGKTSNTGTYSKPTGGIPSTDLSSAVQASLGLADTALQSSSTLDATKLSGTIPASCYTDTTYTDATTSVSGLMSSSDKTKLNGIDENANNYSHPTGDGNLHVPATSTNNNGKFLMAGSAAGSLAWGTPTDTVTTATTTGSGNAVTSITATNGALTVTKGTTFLTEHQDISGKADSATTLAGYGITDAKIANGVITLGTNTITPLTSHQDISGKADSATTLSGYGITDAKIDNGVITLGSKTITPLTEHQDISGKADLSGATFTGAVTVPKIITSTGLEIY